jgi:hypothetical protein
MEQTVVFSPETLAALPRDSVRERAVAGQLRALPEPARWAYLTDLMGRDAALGLAFARIVPLDRSRHERILHEGLARGDASTIKVWLDVAVPRLGVRRALRQLRGALDADPLAVGKALYWVARYAKEAGPDAWDEYQALLAETNRRGGIRHVAPTPVEQPDCVPG